MIKLLINKGELILSDSNPLSNSSESRLTNSMHLDAQLVRLRLARIVERGRGRAAGSLIRRVVALVEVDDRLGSGVVAVREWTH
jgi:hypothetical protein